MILELERVIAEVKPGAKVKPEHIQILARALLAIWRMEAGTGIKITKSEAKFVIETS